MMAGPGHVVPNAIPDLRRSLAQPSAGRPVFDRSLVNGRCQRSDSLKVATRLDDSKEGDSIRPIGLPVVEYLARRRTDVRTYVFPGPWEAVRARLSSHLNWR